MLSFAAFGASAVFLAAVEHYGCTVKPRKAFFQAYQVLGVGGPAKLLEYVRHINTSFLPKA